MSKVGMIFGGGTIDAVFALQQLDEQKPELVIAADKGLAFLHEHRIRPTHIVGDFDSIQPGIVDRYRGEAGITVREFDPVKDETDMELAIGMAVRSGADPLWILGATGTRLDHVWANVQLLKIALDAGAQAYILDAYNRIRLIRGETVLKREQAYGTYFSLFPLGERITGLTIEGAKYPLRAYTLTPYVSRCVSNEYDTQEVRITVREGIAILMETGDTRSCI